MISQPSAPTGILGLRQTPDTTAEWGVSGAQFSELHHRDPSELLLAAGMMVIYLSVQSGFVSKGLSFPGRDKDRSHRQAGRRGSCLCKVTTQCPVSERKLGTPHQIICPRAEELRGLSCCSLSICNQAEHSAARQVQGQCRVNEGVPGHKQVGWRKAGGGLDAADWNCTSAAGLRRLTSLRGAGARERVLAGVV